MSQHVAFAVNNLFQQQLLKVIKPTKRLKYAIESTVKATGYYYLLEYQLANISTGTVMPLIITEESLS